MKPRVLPWSAFGEDRSIKKGGLEIAVFFQPQLKTHPARIGGKTARSGHCDEIIGHVASRCIIGGKPTVVLTKEVCDPDPDPSLALDSH